MLALIVLRISIVNTNHEKQNTAIIKLLTPAYLKNV